jgi:hypothetical protein
VDARESFRQPFVEVARTRYARIEDVLSSGGATDLKPVASELHCLSGEAAMLDFGKVADLARVAEDAAKKSDRSRLGELLRELHDAIGVVERGGAE